LIILSPNQADNWDIGSQRVITWNPQIIAPPCGRRFIGIHFSAVRLMRATHGVKIARKAYFIHRRANEESNCA
jgi:hypothetical protein